MGYKSSGPVEGSGGRPAKYNRTGHTLPSARTPGVLQAPKSPRSADGSHWPPNASAPQPEPPPPPPAADAHAGAPPVHSARRPQHAAGQRADSRDAPNTSYRDAVGAPVDHLVPQGALHAHAPSSQPPG
eukprot:6212632-Pleurochrysis_carterae.AAC.3